MKGRLQEPPLRTEPGCDAPRDEVFVCGQCPVEYYCAGNVKLAFPWGNGLRVEDAEEFWDGLRFPDGQQVFDFSHKESGAKVLKAQHLEFELWSQGIHARSPLLNLNRACQTCHHFPEEEIRERVEGIQQRNFDLLQRAGAALMDQLDAIEVARAAGASGWPAAPGATPPRQGPGVSQPALTSMFRGRCFSAFGSRRSSTPSFIDALISFTSIRSESVNSL